MSTYCIGDVHGCYKELQELLDKIGASLKDDVFWFTGDLVNRGADSLAVLRYVKELPRKVVVLGNHDLHLLALYNKVMHPAAHTLDAVLAAKDRGDLLDWLKMQPLMHYEAEVNWVLSHAGIYPLWDVRLAQVVAKEVAVVLQSADAPLLFRYMYGNVPDRWHDNLSGWERLRFIINCFTRMRFCDITGRLEFSCQGPDGTQPAGFFPWFKVPGRLAENNHIVFGHWAALADIDMFSLQMQTGFSDMVPTDLNKDVPARAKRSLLDVNEHCEQECDKAVSQNTKSTINPVVNVFGLDTGCVWGGALTAMRLEDGKIFCVNCR